jgi:hypothetical protein
VVERGWACGKTLEVHRSEILIRFDSDSPIITHLDAATAALSNAVTGYFTLGTFTPSDPAKFAAQDSQIEAQRASFATEHHAFLSAARESVGAKLSLRPAVGRHRWRGSNPSASRLPAAGSCLHDPAGGDAGSWERRNTSGHGATAQHI